MDGGALARLSAPTYELVGAPDELSQAALTLTAAFRVAVDTESDSRHRYPERVCLVQIAGAERVYLIDPLLVPDLAPLRALLESRRVEKILHGADYDLRGLHRDWSFTTANIFDTYVAARLVGIEQVGLSALASALLGLDLPKEARIQKQDWSKRPLTQTALDYAAADVAHLAEIRDALAERLAALGRQAWAEEEFARLEQVRHRPPDPDRALFSFKEGRGLDGRGLAVLRALLETRDAEARRLTRPPAFVIPNAALGELAANPRLDPADAPSMPPAVARRLGEKLRRAVKRGLAAPEVRRPAPELPPRPRPSRAEAARIDQRLKRLKQWRTGEAARLSIDPALVWPARSLERLSRDPRTLDDELATPDVRRWQQREFAPSLAHALDG